LVLIDQQTGECTKASTIKGEPQMRSPAALNIYMRDLGRATYLNVSRSADGTLQDARVVADKVEFRFYPSASLCEAARVDRHDQLPSEELQ
jgi:hypothetical protein